MTSQLKFLRSSRGGQLLVVNNYCFKRDRNVDEKIYYKCRQCSDGCPARVILINENLTITKENHSHESDIQYIIKLETKNEIKEEISNNPSQPIKQIYNKVISSKRQKLKESFNSTEVASSLPTFSQISSSSYKKRSEFIPIEPSSRSQLILNNEWTTTVYGNNFLIINSGEEDKILVFATIEFFQILTKVKTVFCDGTFRSVPKIFAQLYTFHGVYLGQMFPLIYALLPDKTKETYIRLFRLLQDYGSQNNLQFSPNHFQIDFEVSAIKAINLVYQNARITGCLFHFSQCHWRKVQKLGLTNAYDTDKNVRNLVKRISALPFLPLQDIDNAWEQVINDTRIVESDGPIAKYISYAYDTWVKNGSKFCRDMWNHYGNFAKRTTNDLEGWHQCFNKNVGKRHANTFKFINALKSEQEKFETQKAFLDVGNSPPKIRRKYSKLNRKIEKLTQNYNEGLYDNNEKSILDFLDAIGFSLKFKS
jgi:hypothetical protein